MKYAKTSKKAEEEPNKTRLVTAHSKTDSFGRKVFDEVQFATGCVSRHFSYHEGVATAKHYEHEKVKSAPTTQLVKQIVLSDGRTLSYEYDAEERITKVTDSVEGITEYTYDALGQLLTETVNGVVVNSMVYDNYGNILSKNGKQYCYDATWRDLLTCYDGQCITYDAQDNPTYYLGHTLTWEKGRQLKSFDGNTYTYNANGIRTSKTINGIKHTYTLDGTKILREEWMDECYTTHSITPLYDNEDSVCGIIYNGVPHYFLKNLQGDIIAIVDKNSETVAKYSYDAWGVCTVTQDSVGIATVNPFRYRSYYYDVEIGLYYLQSRYYDPRLGRFINGDDASYISVYASSLCNNLFAYCQNMCVVGKDSSGYFFFPKIVFVVVFTAVVVVASVIALKSCSNNSKKTKIVTVMSCTPNGWIESSNTMGKDMAKAFGNSNSYTTKTVPTKSDFEYVWKNANKCVIIHTHGSPTGLFDQGSNGTPKIISTSEISKMSKNDSIYFVMMTACSTAGGDEKNNVAYHLSKKINSKGIVIANKYTVSGGSTKFKASNGNKGWVAYKNGKVVRKSDSIPAELTMKKAYKIYKELT